MCAIPVSSESWTEEFAGELTEVAYPVALKHGVRGSWLDFELDVWKALQKVLRRQHGEPLLIGVDNPSPPMLEEMEAELTQAAYQVALRRGFSGSFLDVELGLWQALREAY